MPLWASMAGVGSSACTPSKVRRSAGGGRSLASAGMPMSATMISPQYKRSGYWLIPSFSAPNVTVTSARNVPLQTAPLAAIPPLGTSHAMRT